MSTITETISPADQVLSVVFANAAGTIGIERADTNAVVVASGTPLVNTAAGVWSKTFTDPAPGLPYNYWIQVAMIDGKVIRFERQMTSSWATAMPPYGQTDALALAVTDWLTANSGGFLLPIAVERRFRLVDDLPNIPAYNQPVSVDIFPDTEISERQGMSTAFASTYAIHVFIQQQVSGAASEDGQCAKLTALRSQILESLKLRSFDLTTAVHSVRRVFLANLKSADRGLYNLARLLDLHVYESDTVLTFRAAA